MQDDIAAMPGWKKRVGRDLDRRIAKTVSDVQEAVRGNTPFYGIEGLARVFVLDHPGPAHKNK